MTPNPSEHGTARPLIWRLSARHTWRLSRPHLLGILNTTPDSFFDGGAHASVDRAVAAGERMMLDGADGLDVGGESTRPGASPVPAREQIARTRPVIEGLRARLGDAMPITIDTTSAEVAAAALDAGADAVNDVSGGLDDAGLLALCARRGAGIVLMHRPRAPKADAFSHRYGEEGQPAPPMYEDVVLDVRAALAALAARAEAAGVAREAIALDPGLGFGKSVEQNLELIRRSRELLSLGYPLVSGLSRKSFVGRAMTPPDQPVPEPQDRLAGTLILSLMHARCGASILRVHDVRAHREVLRVARDSERREE